MNIAMLNPIFWASGDSRLITSSRFCPTESLGDYWGPLFCGHIIGTGIQLVAWPFASIITSELRATAVETIDFQLGSQLQQSPAVLAQL